MAYKHILIAVDLSPESKVLVEKAVSMARPYNAKVSLIHVDVNYSDLYTGLIDVNLGDMQKRISEETHHALTELSTNAGYPITETLSGSGDLGQVLVDAIKEIRYGSGGLWSPPGLLEQTDVFRTSADQHRSR
ncbi:universal stress protein A [Escherichia coli]|uniref:Universal stress protein A n=1 Tax=Escherichia coli TaxID=562 RepID=A0A377AMP4_ECOLX|nr:universal stress protein A [Escherichia coli]